MKYKFTSAILFFLFGFFSNFLCLYSEEPPPLYSWKPDGWDNFGDALSKPIIERLLKREIKSTHTPFEHKLLSLGSILHSALNGDVVWGTGIMTGWFPEHISQLDVRAVRGPLTRDILLKKGIQCPAVYGDPALLIPLLFPEFTCNPVRDYIVIPHASETSLFANDPNMVSPREPWETVVKKITESKFVIASSLHGIIVAEAFGIPARMVLSTNNSQYFKYMDYYHATGRPNFKYATSVKEALKMGGEPPAKIDLIPLIESFPFDLWGIE
jgi:pyruvyltransferase